MTVRQSHTRSYADPVRLRAGDEVAVACDDLDFPGWWWSRGPDGREGWVPEAILSWDETAGGAGSQVADQPRPDEPDTSRGPVARLARVREDYSALELTVVPGDEVTMLRGLAGWAWVRTVAGEEGWVPEGCLAAKV